MFSQARVDYPWRWEGVTPSTGYGNSGRGIYFSLLWLDIGAGSITRHNPLIILNQALVSFLSFFLSFFSSFFFLFCCCCCCFFFCFVLFFSFLLLFFLLVAVKQRFLFLQVVSGAESQIHL